MQNIHDEQNVKILRTAFGSSHFQCILASNPTYKFYQHLKRNKSKTWQLIF